VKNLSLKTAAYRKKKGL